MHVDLIPSHEHPCHAGATSDMAHGRTPNPHTKIPDVILGFYSSMCFLDLGWIIPNQGGTEAERQRWGHGDRGQGDRVRMAEAEGWREE